MTVTVFRTSDKGVMQTIDALQSLFGMAGHVAFRRTPDGAEVIDVAGAGGRAVVALKGAQVLGFTPDGQRDLLWLSPLADVAGPTAMRGGVPVCWPWFADHPTDPRKPAHGFARTARWDVIETARTPDGQVRVALAFATAPGHAALWPHAARARLEITVGSRLSLTLATENTGSTAFALSQALHAYFAVGDVAKAVVEGLDGTAYLDKVDGFARKRQAGPVTFAGEVDRIYVGTTAATTLADPVLARRITIAKQGSASTVVWNPWAERATRFSDIGTHWRGFVCVETANAADDTVRLAPGGRHELGAVYGLA